MPAGPGANEAVELGGVQLGAHFVTFQRFLTPASGAIDVAPQSLGALPVARVSEGHLVAARRARGFLDRRGAAGA